jgi:hypothetical protein
MLAPDQPLIAHAKFAFEDALGADATCNCIRQPPFAWDNDFETTLRGEHSSYFVESSREICEVLEHVNRDHPIEISIIELEPLLTVADQGCDLRIPLLDDACEVLPEFQRVVVLSSQILKTKMLPEASSELERTSTRCLSGAWISLVEALDATVSSGKDLQPAGHELVPHALLFLCEVLETFRPDSGAAMIDDHSATVSRRSGETAISA